MRTTLKSVIIIIFITSSIMGCTSKRMQEMPTDAQMIGHFNRYEKEFEKLCSMIEEDSLWKYPLSYLDKKGGDSLHISANRQLEYDSLMEKLQIIRFVHPKWAHNRNDKTIRFFSWGIGDATWGIDKGYEYAPERNNEEGKKFAEEELYDLAMKIHENCNLYKKINKNWDLFFMYDR